MVREGPCPAEKITVLGKGGSNGVDAAGLFNPATIDPEKTSRFRKRLGLPSDAPIVGFVGRIVDGKGVPELADAWKTIAAGHQAAHLLMIGPVEPMDGVSDRVLQELRNDRRVVMVGSAPKREMPLYYALMDLIVFPSRSEGFPNVPLEASAMGLPVAAATASGTVDAVRDGVTGILFPQRDPERLAEAVLSYLADDELRTAHGSAGRESVLRDFRPEIIWEALFEEYRTLMRERGLSRPSETTGDANNSPPSPETEAVN